MPRRLSADQFQANLEHFKGILTQAGKVGPDARRPGWDTPEGALDQCIEASRSYQDRPDSPHPDTTTTRYFAGFRGDVSQVHTSLRELHPADSYADPAEWKHYVTVTDTDEGPMAVDWTARQFDASADFPHVEHLDEFSKRWDSRFPT